MHSGLYISVPFCRSKCTYCNFASGVFSAGQMGRYVERLIEDMRGIRAYAAKIGAVVPETVDSIYLGGGTPSLLPAEELKKLFFAIRQEFKVLPKAEITVECAPGTLTDEVVQALTTRGVNRVSLGVQSFVDKEAASVARLHPAERGQRPINTAQISDFSDAFELGRFQAAAINYEDFADFSAGSGNYVNYADQTVDNANTAGRTASSVFGTAKTARRC